MFKANEYEGLLGSAHSSGEAIEFRELMQSYLAPAKNAWPIATRRSGRGENTATTMSLSPTKKKS